MRVFENQCCSCATPAYPCIGSACPNRNVLVYYCDICNSPIEEGHLYCVDEEDVCEDCLKNKFRKDYM